MKPRQRWRLQDWARVVRPGRDGQLRIDARRIYIMPTRYGVVFGLLLLLLLIGAVNYANNPAFLLTFLLAVLAGNAIYQTWRNLRGLACGYTGCRPVFAGQTAQPRFWLQHGSGAHPALQLALEGGDPVVLDLPADERTPVTLATPTRQRGRMHPGRLTISTRYPLGLFVAWAYLEPEASWLVYPRPRPGWRPPPDSAQAQSGQGGAQGAGTDDFSGLRAYRPGDHPRHIDWRAFAAERGLLTKQFGGERFEQLWLRWDQLPGAAPEQRLEYLCQAVLEAERHGQRYALELPGVRLPPGQGTEHQGACLRALALHAEEPAP